MNYMIEENEGGRFSLKHSV